MKTRLLLFRRNFKTCWQRRAGSENFERETESYYQAILHRKYDVVRFEELRLDTEALLKQLADDNARLDGILESAKPSADSQSTAEQFSVLRQRVLHVVIVNDLPVELHGLQQFLVEKKLTERDPFREFYNKWLTRTPVLLGTPG